MERGVSAAQGRWSHELFPQSKSQLPSQLNPVHNPPEQKMLRSQPLDNLIYED